MTTSILRIDTSPLGERSVSRKLTNKIIGGLHKKFTDSVITTRDFADTPLPHLDARTLGAFFTAPDQRTPDMAEAIQRSDTAIDELLAADIIVIGAPMWNFGIPSSLKAWIDHISRAGRTFKYTPTGPIGLIPAGKKVIIVSSRGGVYSTGDYQALDHQEKYLKAALGFLGITDISVVRAEGVALGEESLAKAMNTADAEISSLLQKVA